MRGLDWELRPHLQRSPQGNGSEVEHRLRGQVSLVNYIILKTFGIQFIGKPGGRKFFSNLKASVEQK